jgi:uncharacterized protein (TIGR02231 family)
MRVLFCIALLMPGAALADTILATSRVTAVTIYPDGAQVTREVAFSAPAGSHEVLITDLPGDTEADLLRVASSDTDLGSFALREERLPPRDDAISAETQDAKDAVKVARVALRGAEAKVAGIRAEIEAQEAQIRFLNGVTADGTVTADCLSAVSQMIGTEVLTARRAALAAAAALPDAEEAVTEAQDEVVKAEAAAEALAQRDEDYQALWVTVTTKGGEGHLVVTHFISQAGWGPVYDITLDRQAGKLAVARGVLVGQYSGEDWAGVDLTLSTARPSSRSEPARLWPQLRRIDDPVAPEDIARMDAEGGGLGGMAEPVMEAASPAAVTSAVAYYRGDTVVYHYPAPVDLATGVEALRLKLDELNFAPKVSALAVPRYEETAFMMAKLTNDSPDILLPGTAYLYRDGAMVGRVQLAALVPGAEMDLGFGAIDGLRLTRDMPKRAEGDRGIISTLTQISEKAVLEVENLTGKAWPVRVLDMVPYSEQEDLEISYSADPTVSEEGVDGERGILAWDFDLGPKETKTIMLESLISWPEGKVLQ